MAVTKSRRVWQYEDLLALPDDGRHYEIIDGELFELPPRGTDHANAVANLLLLLLPPFRAFGARLLTGPLDVFFPGADPVEPDILLLLPDRRDRASKRGIEGAPDLVIEVLCPFNPRHDRITKRALYARGGVPEYWLVDPAATAIEVLVLNGGVYRTQVHAAGDELVSSPLLPGFAFPASAAFI